MQKKYPLLVVLIVLLQASATIVLAQEKTPKTLFEKLPIRNPVIHTAYDTLLYNLTYPKDSIKQRHSNDASKMQSIKLATSYYTLNTYFANLLSPFVTQTTDISASTAYAILDNTDGYAFLGTSFSINKQTGSTPKRKFITIGLKIKAEDGFATIFDKNGLNKDFGFSGKFTWLGRGSIWVDKETAKNVCHRIKIENNRVTLARQIILDEDKQFSLEHQLDPDKYKKFFQDRDSITMLKDELKNIESTIKYLKIDYRQQEIAKLKQDSSQITNIIKRLQNDLSDSAKKIIPELQKKSSSIIEQYASQEAKELIEQKLINFSYNWWITIDAYIPFKNRSYNYVSTDIAEIPYAPKTYYPANVGLSYNNLWQSNRSNFFILPHGSYNLTFRGQLLQDNSVNAQLLKHSDFTQIVSIGQDAGTQYEKVEESATVYIGDYQKFITPSLSGRLVYMTSWKQSLGLSLSIQQNFGLASDTNWKLGIPVSLKNNEGKSKVNFEFLWKEIHQKHSLGLSLSLPIGDNIF